MFAEGDHYRLDHDFAFPDRPASIERFTLKFEHDPVWKAETISPLEKQNVPPGESVVLHLPLQYTGVGEPAFINRPAPPPAPLPPPPPPEPPLTMPPQIRAAAVALLLATFLLLVVYFFRREKSVGRFESWDQLLPTGEAWLQQNIFAYPAEVVGAAWDETSSEPEVSALLARLIQEGKIVTLPKEINKQVSVVVLRLNVRREELQEHERALVDGLFVRGDITDRPTIMAHYSARGFDPAEILRAPMMRKVDQATARTFGAPTTTSRKVGGLLIFILALTLVVGFASLSFAQIGGPLILFPLLAGVCLIAALAAASWYRRKVHGMWAASIVIAPLIVLVSVAALTTHPVLFAIFGIESLLLSWYVLRKARWHGTREFLQWRRNLVAARDWFAFELGKPDPELKDEWTPYLISFGLTTALDEWTRRFAAPKTRATPTVRGYEPAITPLSSSSPPPSPSPSSEPVRRWTGGGGAFGAAGATGSWASEVQSFAAVIPPPAPVSTGSSGSWSSSSSFSSSGSSSSFSSSSSSSRSGGGGGGGW